MCIRQAPWHKGLLRFQVMQDFVRLIERLNDETNTFLLLDGAETSREPFSPNFLVDHLPVQAVLVVVLMCDEKVLEPT